MATQEDMYIETTSDPPNIYSALYNMHKANMIAYSDLQ